MDDSIFDQSDDMAEMMKEAIAEIEKPIKERIGLLQKADIVE